MWSFVGAKERARWLWHAIDHHTGRVLAYVVGPRKDAVFLNLKALLAPLGITHYYTDKAGVYQRHLPLEQHDRHRDPHRVRVSRTRRRGHKLGAVDFLEKPFDPKAMPLLVEEIRVRNQFGPTSRSVDGLLQLAALAQERKAHGEARAYLKTALLRDRTRPEPYCRLGVLSDHDGDTRQAAHYYSLALEVNPTFQPAREALMKVGRMNPNKR
jgi:IS1 family transposase